MPAKRYLAIALCLAMCVMAATRIMAQSLITGNISGTVTDASDAVIAGATVTLNSVDTGTTQQQVTTDTGFFRFSLLKPGNYTVTIKQAGFGTIEQPVTVSVGQTSVANVKLQVSAASQTVEVSGEAVQVITAAPNQTTSFTQQEVQMLPNPGGDLTNIAQSAPGVVMNNTGGYGNFTMNGMPATSNMFTVNGENDMDPYFNINNSGATNMTIGSNEIQEATVLSNPYSGEYGQLSGAQVTYVTKSGTNLWHGNALYWWNGRAMNSNDWMNNNTDPQTPRPFSNANQWAASVGGPIVKNKTFFFIDTEGLRFLLPNVISTTIPTTDFANAVLANVQAKQPAEVAMYQKMFNLWASATGASGATALPNSSYCNSINLVGFNPATQACAQRFQSTPSALGTEWILAFRIDQNIGQNDKLFGRYKMDHGTQPTYLDPIDSGFDALSNQPSWDVQAQETHIFSPTMTNAFTAAGSHYVAQFQQNQPSAANTFPYAIITSGAVPFTSFNPMYEFPQGRNITQYQFIDDFAMMKGKHSLKFGVNYRRYDVSDHNFFFNYPAVYFGYVSSGLQKFVDGLAYQYRQSDNLASNVPVAMWGTGFYGMDEWKVKSNLTLTLALRFEYNSNPVCQINCFANFKSNWYSLPSYTSSDPGNVPYNQDIATGLHQAFQNTDGILLSPRFGFSWSPYSNGKTVISGGFGLFYDSPAAGLVDDLLANPPVAVSIRVRPSSGTPWADPGPTGSAAIYQASATAFNQGFASGQTYSQISAELAQLGVPFAPPAFTAIPGTMHAPRWQEWNLQFQQEITNNTALVINYVGNHGIRIPYTSSFMNAYDQYGLYPDGTFPAAAPVPNYGTVSQVTNGGVSNYNGLTVTLRRSFTNWFSAHANYTWAHNIDDLSNGGLFTYGDSLALQQICPGSLRQCNYGSSDYDIRNGFNADFVFRPNFTMGNEVGKALANGWEFTGKIFWRSGLPLSIEDGNSALGNFNGPILGYPTYTGSGQVACGSGNASADGTANPCLNADAFIDGASATFNQYPGVSPQRRNSFYGPRFFDMDMGVTKYFKIKERLTFAVGAQFFNVFNHPNFSNPDATLGDTTFGQISAMQNMPTSPYGTFLGFDSSVRVIQLNGRLTF